MEQTQIVYHCGKIALLGLLPLVALLTLGGGKEVPSLAGRVPSSEAREPLEALKNFQLVPGSVAVIEDKYVLALLETQPDALYAVVMFAADCRSEGCIVGDLIAYSVDEQPVDGIEEGEKHFA